MLQFPRKLIKPCWHKKGNLADKIAQSLLTIFCTIILNNFFTMQPLLNAFIVPSILLQKLMKDECLLL